MRLFDTHSHYKDEKFDEEREEIIELIENSKKVIEIAKNHDFIYSAVRNAPNRNSRK